MAMRRVLFLAYLFPPIANSGTRRSLAFVNHLPDCGWHPLVLGWDPEPHVGLEPEMLAELRPGTRIERVPLLSRLRAQRWAGWLPRAVSRRLVEALAWRLRVRSTVPDEAAGWLKPAVERAVELHRREGFDAIYASGWPWTAFLIAREVSRRTGKPYVLDYRDQWTPSGDMAWEQATPEQLRDNPALERLAAKDAAAIVTVTRALVDSVGRDCGRDDLHLITNGFEPSDFAGEAPPPGDGLLRIAYTGVWRPGYGLHDLYAAVALLGSQGHPELARLRVLAAGFAPGPAAEAGVSEWVSELGRVPHGEAVTLMKQADLLYLPVPTGYYAIASLPGKLFEYLACGRPILAIVPAASEVAQVLDDTGGGVRVEPGDVAGLALTLLAWLRGEAQVAPPHGIDRYSRAATAQRLARVLDAAVDGRRLEATP
ncbi:glycosyltransferase [Paucibacter sp. R3-3]|uniref:Glycosyltransferase n=1 Tax=Roseateles agri TaxID=3098619 RepID=A0ABU5DLR2_9BURK|nr:glycosyltransferase [Paucibacter sp. R3-3]MDY0747251.1 glycosyltransferase [Paucibacter sp. R3-3]